MLQLMPEGCSYTYPPLSITRYSFIHLSELEQCRVKKFAQGFNTAEQDSNPGSLSRESEALSLSHCSIYIFLKTTRNIWLCDSGTGQCSSGHNIFQMEGDCQEILIVLSFRSVLSFTLLCNTPFRIAISTIKSSFKTT